MRGAVFALLAACSFDHGVIGRSTDGGGDIDAATATADAACFGVLDLCTQPMPTASLDIVGADVINTDTDPRCQTVTQVGVGGGEVCLVYATSVSLGSSGSLTATGSRPLAIASTSTVVIAGLLDVSSRIAGQRGPASSDASCTYATTPDNDTGGAGGGAGGSFGTAGSKGGIGDSDNSLGNDGTASPGTPGPLAMPTVLRGGCRGQKGGDETNGGGVGGSGGHSGGALYVYAAQSVQIPGQIRATGAGGSGGEVQAGGGGGGSGGLVVIESPMIAIAGVISANGGGGGEGGARVGQNDVDGQPGTGGALGTTPAAGGMGTDNRFGYGGAGAASVTAAVDGTSSIVAGGGGGGGVGIIKLVGTSTVSGILSPPAM